MLGDFLGFLKVSLSRHNDLFNENCTHYRTVLNEENGGKGSKRSAQNEVENIL